MTDGPLTHFHLFTFLRLLADLYNREREEWEAEVHSRYVYLYALVCALVYVLVKVIVLGMMIPDRLEC